MSEASEVLLDKRGTAFWITIHRPERRNALNAGVLAGLRQGLRQAQADADVRAIVLTGSGDTAFCAGADLQPGQAFRFDFATLTLDYADLLREAHDTRLPIIARINGACMAGGMGLACMADMAVAAEHAQFGLPEVRVGVFPMQVMSLLKDLVPPRVLREWALCGEPFDAQEALRHGLVNHVVPSAELDDKTGWLLARLADKSPTAIRRGKYAMRAIAAMSFEQSIAFTESQIALLAQTEGAREGLAAFAEKRPTAFTGR